MNRLTDLLDRLLDVAATGSKGGPEAQNGMTMTINQEVRRRMKEVLCIATEMRAALDAAKREGGA